MSKQEVLSVGLNYNMTNMTLKGCVNVAQRMKECLIKHFGFMEEDIIVFIDTDPASIVPSASNELSALLLLVGSAEASDVLFFHFSGHGGRYRAVPQESNNTGFVEFIVAADGSHLTDNTFRMLVDMVGCSFTILADCCHSGGLIEGATKQIRDSTEVKFGRFVNEFGDILGDYCYVSNRVKFGFDRNQCKGHVLTGGPSSSSLLGEGILLSACQAYQLAKEMSFTHNIDEVCGVFSNAILATMEETCGQVTNWDLVKKASKKLKSQGLSQTPGLYCSDRHAHAIFLSVNPVDTQRVKGQHLLGGLVVLAPMFVKPRLSSRYHQRYVSSIHEFGHAPSICTHVK